MIGRRVGLGRAPLRHSVGLGYVVDTKAAGKTDETFLFRHKLMRAIVAQHPSHTNLLEIVGKLNFIE